MIRSLEISNNESVARRADKGATNAADVVYKSVLSRHVAMWRNREEEEREGQTLALFALLLPLLLDIQLAVQEQAEYGVYKAAEFAKLATDDFKVSWFTAVREYQPMRMDIVASIIASPEFKRQVASNAEVAQLNIVRLAAEFAGHGIALSNVPREVVLARLKKKAEEMKRKMRLIVAEEQRKVLMQTTAIAAKAMGIRYFEWVHNYRGEHPRLMHKATFPEGLNGGLFTFDDLPVIAPDGYRGLPGSLPYCQCTMRLVRV